MHLNILTLLASIALLATFTFAGLFITHPVGNTRWILGTNATISWLAANELSTTERLDITLMFGKAEDLDKIITITKGISNKRGFYKWNISTTLAPGTLYVVRLDSGSNATYSHYFEIEPSRSLSRHKSVEDTNNGYTATSLIATFTPSSKLSSNYSTPSSQSPSLHITATATPGLPGKIPTMIGSVATKLNSSNLVTLSLAFIISYACH